MQTNGTEIETGSRLLPVLVVVAAVVVVAGLASLRGGAEPRVETTVEAAP